MSDDRLMQLKAAAYDLLVQLEQTQVQLRQVNQAIAEETHRREASSAASEHV